MPKTLKNGTKIKKFQNWQNFPKKILAAFFTSYSTIQRKTVPVSNFTRVQRGLTDFDQNIKFLRVAQCM
jgi:hypothetical protein